MRQRPPVVPWKKRCSECGGVVAHFTAFAHLRSRHGTSFRVDAAMRKAGMPEETFDELLRSIAEQDAERKQVRMVKL